MKSTYKKMWEMARPYYIRGREFDIDHIQWFMKMVNAVCKKENLDETLLMPLAILHDVGYSTVNNPTQINYYDKDIRKAHMKAGGEIAKQILVSINYPEDKTKKIIKYIQIHDNWSFGEVDIYLKDKILGTFKDLDYLWSYTNKGCQAVQKVLNKNNKEMLQYLKDEISPIYGKKPFSTLFAQKIREEYLKEREKELV